METKAKRRTALALGAVVGVAAAVALAMLGLSYGTSNPEAFAHVPTPTPTYLRIDADVTNGARPCDPIDAAATVAVGAAHKVGVCIGNYEPNSIEVFELHIRYSGDPDATPPTTLNVAPTKLVGGHCPAGDPYCLNVNPDANDGDDPAGYKLGAYWNCTASTMARPLGEDPSTPGVADARIICNVDLSTPDKDLAADPGLLVTIEFTATSPGADTIDFGPIDNSNWTSVGYPVPGYGDNNLVVAYCSPQWPEYQMGCFGATITKVCADRQIGNGKGIPGEDGTVPDSAAGLEGDACGSTDVDNDGIPNVSDPDPGGDITYDDNNDGIWKGTGDDGPSWDTDMDAKLDGVAACLSPLGAWGSLDSDGDGLLNSWELCKWGTDPTVVDSDGDTLGDCQEVADVDGNGVVNFTGDVIYHMKACLLPPAAFGQDGDFDIDGNNVIAFPGDCLQDAKYALIPGLCK